VRALGLLMLLLLDEHDVAAERGDEGFGGRLLPELNGEGWDFG